MKSHSALFFSFFRSLQTTALVAVILAGTCHGKEAWDWKVKEIDGKEYVTVQAIQDFYHFDRASREGNKLTVENGKVAMTLEIGSTSVALNKIKIHLGNPVIEIDDTAYLSRRDLSALVDPMLRPTDIPNAVDFRTVILDPAHGSKDPGVTNDFGTEAIFTLKVAERTQEELEKKGFRVVMTRNGEDDPTDEQRRDFANAIEGSAIFIHLSFGSGPEESRGIETRTISPLAGEAVETGGATTSYGSASVALATSTHGTLIRNLGRNSEDGGLSRGEISVLSEIRHPSIAITLGNMANPYESKLIHDDRYQKALAIAIREGVIKYQFAASMDKPDHAPKEVSEKFE